MSYTPGPRVFVIENDDKAGNKPIRFQCEQLMEYNKASALKVEYYYDLLYDVSQNTTEDDVVISAQSALLKSVANHFGLSDGARCSIPPVAALWLIDIDSSSKDVPVYEFNSCLELTPKNGQTCTVYKGTMAAHYLGAGDPSSFEKYIQLNLNKIGGKESDFRVAYLGASLDYSRLGTESAKDNLSPSLNRVEAQPTQGQGKRTFTFVGGLIVAGFLAAFLGMFFVLYRRRQKFLSAQDLEIALSNTMNDSPREPRDNDSGILRPDTLEPEIGEETPEQHEDEFSSNNYRFDLATSMKNELFNIHGRAADPPRAYGIGIEETSDSDADSWAQTDGTIGSLELQLEPITAEV